MGKYVWDKSSNEFPTIQPHSITKHEVVREYLSTYMQILGRPYHSSGFYLSLVDGFAGGGLYKKINGDIHHGSPMIFINTVREAEARISQEKEFKIIPKYYFVEKNPKPMNF